MEVGSETGTRGLRSEIKDGKTTESILEEDVAPYEKRHLKKNWLLNQEKNVKHLVVAKSASLSFLYPSQSLSMLR
ncbi:unnamed protein product, partial [Ilex paraguariensis]